LIARLTLESPVDFHWHGISQLKLQLRVQHAGLEKPNANLKHLKSPAGDQTSKAEGATFQWKDALTFFTYLKHLHPKHKIDFLY